MSALRLVEAGAKTPPYPAGTRSRGWQFMLDVERMRQSSTWALCPPHVRGQLVLLWIESWLQIPSGSLPDDDQVLAAICGLPFEQFAVHRAILLRGWWKATDGRFYHPVITALVLDRLEWKETERQRIAAWRQKKRDASQDPAGLLRVTHPNVHVSTDTGAGAGAGAGAVEVLLPLGSVGDSRATVGEGPGEPLRSLTLTPGPPKHSKSKPATHGTRLPRDWHLPNDWLAWALKHRPDWDEERVVRESLVFRDHWWGKSGKDARKDDWLATWRNWIRRAD